MGETPAGKLFDIMITEKNIQHTKAVILTVITIKMIKVKRNLNVKQALPGHPAMYICNKTSKKK